MNEAIVFNDENLVVFTWSQLSPIKHNIIGRIGHIKFYPLPINS